MKKIFLYTMLACMAVSFGSCSDDPMDATENHVYGENENPYLRTDASATIAYTAEFRKGHVEAKTIRLSDYAETIQTKLGMTVDELMSALESGNAVVLRNATELFCFYAYVDNTLLSPFTT